ncbi:MAG: tetratricopeptide repeat protein, partial [Thermoguttaceae bacterium]|nr:tetratricopeptide repeat protein [Thermoguttaceae bacterium]
FGIAYAAEQPAEAKPPTAPLPAMAEVEKAVLQADAATGSLQENWRPVVQLLKEVTVNTPDAVYRLIKGHACLAANENNEAVCLFLTAQVPEAKTAWLQWAQDFCRRHPDSPIAHYYHGDALARLGKYQEAIQALSTAIAKAPSQRHALAFNARGVAYATEKQFRKAREDFQSAIDTSAQQLADAYANIGFLRIDTKEGPEAALKAFDQVLGNNTSQPKKEGLSPEYGLALEGRACIKLVLKQEESAHKDFELAFKYAHCAQTLVTWNRNRIIAYWQGMNESEFLAALQGGDQAGTTIDARILEAKKAWGEYVRNPTQWNYNRFNEKFGALSSDQQERFYTRVMQHTQITRPDFSQTFSSHRDTNANWNRPGGMARHVADLTQVGGIVAGVTITALQGGAAAPAVAGTGGFWATKMRDWTQHNWATANCLKALENKYGGIGVHTGAGAIGMQSSSTPGGVDMSMAHVGIENGEWPFYAYYGLMFKNWEQEAQGVKAPKN